MPGMHSSWATILEQTNSGLFLPRKDRPDLGEEEGNQGIEVPVPLIIRVAREQFLLVGGDLALPSSLGILIPDLPCPPVGPKGYPKRP